MSLFDDLTWRGLVYDVTPELPDLLQRTKLSGYIGFDPTAASLHVGSLLPIMNLARLQRFGHTPIALVGGGTGLIGDPSGKSQERQLLTSEQVEHNLNGLRAQLEPFLDFSAASNAAIMVNNHDWLGSLSLIEFLRDTGKHFTVGYMTAKESVKRRLQSEDGLSYTEFSYMLLQSYDFLVLHDRYDCTLQMGGSDQWGNIVAGVELIRRTRGSKAHGLVSPLVTSSSGTKFGKTEAGTVWLDPAITSPYRFYQFWLNTDDRDVVSYLKYFTWLEREAVDELAGEVERAPERRSAQRTLASEVTRMVHGDSELQKAEQASAVLFGAELGELSAKDIEEIFDEVPSSERARSGLEGEGVSLVDLLAESEITRSKGEARRLLRGGGVRVNNRKVEGEDVRITIDDAIEGRLVVLRKGQRNYHLVRLV